MMFRRHSHVLIFSEGSQEMERRIKNAVSATREVSPPASRALVVTGTLSNGVQRISLRTIFYIFG